MSAPDELIAGRYRLVRLVGSGAMGAVWEARDERLGRVVALKLLHRQYGLTPADAELANQRAMREARITARLHHRYAVPVFDVVEHEGRPCLVMQFMASVPLSTRLKESGPLPLAEAARIGGQVASALAAAHAAGIVHRDIKPGNILLVEGGNAVISDFGISHAYGDATLTATGLVHGTPAFMSPEVALGGPTTSASDVFSLGSTLYAAIEGTPPFGSDSNMIALLHRVASGQFEPPHSAGRLAPLLVSMLALDPQARPTMKQVEDEIAEVTRPAPPPRPIPPVAPPPATVALPPAWEPPLVPASKSRPPARSWIAIALGVLVLLIGVLAAGVALRYRDHGGTTGTGSTPSASRPPSAAASSAKPQPTPTPTTASAQPSASEASSPATSAPPSASATPSGSASSPTAAELAAAITDYYALMPGNTDAGWQRLSAAYQVSPSGGRASYNRFWAGIKKVSVADVVGRPPDRAEATITYTYKKGGKTTERTSFGLIADGGLLKINSSRVIGK